MNSIPNNFGRVTAMTFWTKAIIVLVGLLVFGVNAASADVFSVYLYYDHGRLVFDRNYEKKVEILQGMRVGINYPKGDFKAEVIDQKGSILHSTTFDPRPEFFYEGSGGSGWLDEGQTRLLLPYFSTATRLEIYSPKNVLILEYDISYLANLASVSPSPTSSVQVPQTNAQSTGIASYWWALVILVLFIVAFVIWKRRHNSKLVEQSPS